MVVLQHISACEISLLTSPCRSPRLSGIVFSFSLRSFFFLKMYWFILFALVSTLISFFSILTNSSISPYWSIYPAVALSFVILCLYISHAWLRSRACIILGRDFIERVLNDVQSIHGSGTLNINFTVYAIQKLLCMSIQMVVAAGPACKCCDSSLQVQTVFTGFLKRSCERKDHPSTHLKVY